MPKKPKKSRKDLWIVEFQSPDSSHEGIVAYANRAEAVGAACGFIKYQAKEELEGIEWTEPEAPDLLKQALAAIEAHKWDEAIYAWLEFQNEFDPQDKIAIGPSGDVSDRASDFALLG